ncbi:MAG: tetratricopeptide repeat protein [Aurantibacter sp.]
MKRRQLNNIKMNIEEQNIVLIEKYLEGNLGASEREAFEKRLEDDPEFGQSVVQMENMVSGIKHAGRKDIAKKLADLEATLPEVELEETSNVIELKQSRYRYWGAIAAGLALVLISSLFLLNYNSGQTEQDLFTAYYEPYSGDLSRSGEEDLFDKTKKAEYAYALGQYAVAIPLFEEVISQEPTSKLRFYLGNAYLSTGEGSKAAQQFEAVLRDIDYPLQDQAQWYLALSYLKAGNVDMARTNLEIITENSGSFYHQKAKEVLDRIK